MFTSPVFDVSFHRTGKTLQTSVSRITLSQSGVNTYFVTFSPQGGLDDKKSLPLAGMAIFTPRERPDPRWPVAASAHPTRQTACTAGHWLIQKSIASVGKKRAPQPCGARLNVRLSDEVRSGF